MVIRPCIGLLVWPFLAVGSDCLRPLLGFCVCCVRCARSHNCALPVQLPPDFVADPSPMRCSTCVRDVLGFGAREPVCLQLWPVFGSFADSVRRHMSLVVPLDCSSAPSQRVQAILFSFLETHTSGGLSTVRLVSRRARRRPRRVDGACCWGRAVSPGWRPAACAVASPLHQ